MPSGVVDSVRPALGGCSVGGTLGAVLVATVIVCLAPTRAFGQWLPDRVRTEGEGFRTDRVEVHTSFGAEAGVDSNVFLQQNNRTVAPILRFTGAIFVQPRRVDGDGDQTTSSTANRNIDFNVGLTTSYYHYFTSLVRDNVGAQLDAAVRIRPQGKVGFELRESFNRAIRPFTDGNGATSGSISYGMNRNQTTANLTFHSHGGVVRGNIGYTADITFFDSALFRPNGSIDNRLSTRLTWSFFPRTALVYEGTFVTRSYGLASGMTSYAQLVDSRQVSATVGVNGVLTEKIAMTLSAGYAAGFFASGSEYDGFLARAELRYRPRPGMTFTLGYNRSYQTSYIGNFLTQDTGYASVETAFAGRFVVGSQVSVAYGQTGLALRADGSFLGTYQSRVDVRTLVRLYGEYRPTSFLAITLNFEYLGDVTQFAYTNPPSAGALPDPGAAYQRFDAWLGLRVYH